MRYANRICVGVLAVLVAMSFAGCAQRSTDSPASTTSVGVDTQEGSLMNSVRTEFTPKALRAYVEYVYGDKAGRFLGSAVVEGRKTVPIAEVDGAPATAYAITYYCDPAHDVPFDIGMQQGRRYRQMVHVEGCPKLGDSGTVSMAESQLSGATGVTVDAGRGRVLVVVYKIKDDQEN